MAVAADRLVDRMRARLEKGYWPRLHCMLIVTVSTAVAFLTSVLLLVLRIHWMAVRYGAAALAGYAFSRIAPEAVSIGGVWAHLAAK
jgi:hypothetical protein